ncbi:Regulatory protein RecX [Escherichia coli ISC7]|uniref:Regulatory protein RecX n=1 Tax=Escherichia coli ISC7 TaxID=1432555 RepID=W1EWN9_ECOLX|nr:Regulatory protein RecX [Escherichia coli ISC7]
MVNLCQLFFSEKVKIQRFLLYRGYLMEDIQDIWRNFAD